MKPKLLYQVFKDNPLSSVYDPSDDELEVEFTCKVFFYERNCMEQNFICVEYDSSLKFWEEYE